ncbi:MAG: hypothetical protein J6Z46_08740 [Lachnospiraceae bacterium]|nr:hypothetical protein [Lachnospiraceae bacterium]
MTDRKINIRRIMNLIIVLLVITGLFVMLRNKASQTGLTASGWKNLRYYTTLSNVFAGIVALIQLIFDIGKKKYLPVPKLTAVTAVSLTFLVVAGFFGPLYGWLNLYNGSNLEFHLIVPLLCIAEFLIAGDAEGMNVRHCLLASLSTVVYGTAYVINILINGKGKWPDTNDWYGFLNWGPGPGAVIFAGIIGATFGVACLLVRIKKGKKKRG